MGKRRGRKNVGECGDGGTVGSCGVESGDVEGTRHPACILLACYSPSTDIFPRHVQPSAGPLDSSLIPFFLIATVAVHLQSAH